MNQAIAHYKQATQLAQSYSPRLQHLVRHTPEGKLWERSRLSRIRRADSNDSAPLCSYAELLLKDGAGRFDESIGQLSQGALDRSAFVAVALRDLGRP